jgi:hypothetical protein
VTLPLPGAEKVPAGSVGGGECPPTTPASAPPRQWAARANELAAWVEARLVNRRDVWGGYRAVADRGRSYTGRDGQRRELGRSYTGPAAAADRGKAKLTASRIAQHFKIGRCYLSRSGEPWLWGQTRAQSRVIGLHAASPENTSLWGAVDIDHHGDDNAPTDTNWRAALAWYEKLCRLGFRPLLVDSNGCGGFHLWVLFNQAIPTCRVYAFLGWLVADHAEHGMGAPPECFPKRPFLDERVRYGSWLRVPGLHHTRPHWSRIWDGRRWLEGDEAARHMLSLAGDSPELLPAEVLEDAQRLADGGVTDAAAGRLERAPRPRRDGENADVENRALVPPVANRGGVIPPEGAIPPGHRYDYLFRVGCGERGAGGDEADVLDAIRHANARRCVPPHDDAELRRIAGNVCDSFPAGVRWTVTSLGGRRYYFHPEGQSPPPEAFARPEPTPEQREAERRHAAAWLEAYRADLQRQQQSTGGQAAAVWGEWCGWSNKFRSRYRRRRGCCGLLSDHYFQAVFEKEADGTIYQDDDDFIGSPPCGMINCDFCYGRTRPRQVADSLACVLQRTPKDPVACELQETPPAREGPQARREALKRARRRAKARAENDRQRYAFYEPLERDGRTPAKMPASLLRTETIHVWKGTLAGWEPARRRRERAAKRANRERAARGSRRWPLARAGSVRPARTPLPTAPWRCSLTCPSRGRSP